MLATMVRGLKKELAQVTEERDILKSSLRIRQGCKVKYAFVIEHRLVFSVSIPAHTSQRLIRLA